MTVVLCGLGLNPPRAAVGEAPTQVTLQLQGPDAYQFAGYYVAQALGLYREKNIEVAFATGSHRQNIVGEVISGRAQFGILDTDLVVNRAAGDPVVVLAAIGQHNPVVLVTVASEGISTPSDFLGKSIHFGPGGGNAEIEALLQAEGLGAGEYQRVDPARVSDNPLADLLAGKFDAVAIHLTKAAALDSDFPANFHVIKPRTFGMDFYSNCLFTSEEFLAANPDLVRDFREVSLLGWQYAMIHKEETIQLLKKEYLQDITVERLQQAATLLQRVIEAPHGTSGRMNRHRWQRIVQSYGDLGLIQQDLDLDRFLYNPDVPGQVAPGTHLNFLLIGLNLLLGSALLVVLLHRRRSSAVSDNAKELSAKVLELAGERDQILTELRANEAVLRRGIDAVGAAIWDWNLTTGKIYVSDFFLELTGYTREALDGLAEDSIQFVHREDRDRILHTYQNYLAGHQENLGQEFRFRFADGIFRWIFARAVVSLDEKGEPTRLVGSFTDITDRVAAEEERDRLFNLSMDMLSVGGFDRFLQQVNPAWVRLLGWSRDELMSHPVLFFIHPEDQEVTLEAFRRLEAGEPVTGLENRFRCREGNFRWLSWSSFPYPDRQLIFSVVRDINEHKKAQSRAKDYHDRLRSLTNQLSLVEDRQRRQLANAIHDGLAQQLFGVRAKVTLLKYPEKLGDYSGTVEEVLSILDETMTQARTLSFELFPPVLYEVGLEAALVWLAKNFHQRTEIQCEVQTEGEGEELVEDIRAMAYQSVRELLNNTYKHAEATKVHISLNFVEDFLTILVEDDGIGFDVDLENSRSRQVRQPEGFGLFSIRERIRSIDGRMLVDSREGHGCRVLLSFPVHSS